MYTASDGLLIPALAGNKAPPTKQACPQAVAVVVESAVEPQKTANAVVIVVVVVIVIVILVLVAVKSSSHSISTACGGAGDLPARRAEVVPWLRIGPRVVSGARREHKTAFELAQSTSCITGFSYRDGSVMRR